jgi:TPP-dependent pyruvate/acetoin dehydrogenase alpha subunit
VPDSWFSEVEEEARLAVAELRASLAAAVNPPPVEMFDFVYAAPPPALALQRRQLEELLAPDA